jgi:hypothetical protein
MIRKRFSSFARLYFLFKRYQKRSLLKKLVSGLKDCFVQVKAVRRHILDGYLQRQAVKIQKVYRGWHVRAKVQPLRMLKAFS